MLLLCLRDWTACSHLFICEFCHIKSCLKITRLSVWKMKLKQKWSFQQDYKHTRKSTKKSIKKNKWRVMKLCWNVLLGIKMQEYNTLKTSNLQVRGSLKQDWSKGPVNWCHGAIKKARSTRSKDKRYKPASNFHGYSYFSHDFMMQVIGVHVCDWNSKL